MKNLLRISGCCQPSLALVVAKMLAVILLVVSPCLAIDLRSDLGGRRVTWQVDYEQSRPATPAVIPVSMPEQVIESPIPDGFVAPELAGPMGGCGPTGCGPVVGSACGPHCGGCNACAGNVWGGVEFIHWWHRSSVAPPLATDGPLPTANVFAGNERLFDESRSGMRLSLGWWNPQCNRWGLMARYYMVADAEYLYEQSGDGVTMNLSRPFYNLSASGGSPIGNDSFDVAFGGDPGTIRIAGQSTLQGGDILGRHTLKESRNGSLDLMLGYTMALIDEDLLIRSESQLQGGNVVVTDQFSTTNRFHAGAVGVVARSHYDCITLEFLGKLSFGGMDQTARVSGTFDGQPGGLLAQPDNSGEFNNNVFVVAPEVGLNMVYQPTPCLDVLFGYSLLYWSSVAQATELIDPLLRVSPNNPLAPGDLPQPGFEFRNSDMIVHGLNVGLRFSF